MSGKATLMLLATFAAGTAAGWLAKPDAPAASPRATKSAERNPAARPGREASAQTEAARRWMDRIESSGVRDVAKEIPTGDFTSVVESLMTSVWGGMSDEQLEQFMVLIGNWADRDLEGALAWARALDNPKQREVGMIAIAAKVAAKDPKAAFEIYAELEEVTTDAGGYLSPMMRTLYNDAARQGVEAVLDLAKRTPRNGTSASYGVFIEYPEGFDFRAMIDGLVKTTELGGSEEVRKPFSPGYPFGAWALRDAEAAFRYVVEGTSRGQFLRWSDMPHELGKKWGSLEADRWMGAKLVALSPNEQRALLAESDLTDSQGTLRKYITNMPTEEASAEFRFQYLDSTKNGMLGSSLEVLNDLPDVEERVAIVERLRDVKIDFGLREFLKKWEIPADRIDRIIKTVAQPAAP